MKYDFIVSYEVADKPKPPRVVHYLNGDLEIVYTVTQDTMDEFINKLAHFEYQISDT